MLWVFIYSFIHFFIIFIELVRCGFRIKGFVLGTKLVVVVDVLGTKRGWLSRGYCSK